jgi:hypothetical protein
MAVKTKAELLEAIRRVVGESTDDSALAIIEDVSDSIDSLEANSGADWKAKYEQNDAAWRQKYKDRFFAASDPDDDAGDSDDEHPLTFEALFKEE